MLKVSRLTVEGLERNVVTDEEHPHISVKVEADGKDVELKNVHIEIKEESGKKMWSFDTPIQIEIPYAGDALAPETRYEVLVRVLDNRGESAEESMSFMTGLLGRKW